MLWGVRGSVNSVRELRLARRCTSVKCRTLDAAIARPELGEILILYYIVKSYPNDLLALWLVDWVDSKAGLSGLPGGGKRWKKTVAEVCEAGKSCLSKEGWEETFCHDLKENIADGGNETSSTTGANSVLGYMSLFRPEHQRRSTARTEVKKEWTADRNKGYWLYKGSIKGWVGV